MARSWIIMMTYLPPQTVKRWRAGTNSSANRNVTPTHAVCKMRQAVPPAWKRKLGSYRDLLWSRWLVKRLYYWRTRKCLPWTWGSSTRTGDPHAHNVERTLYTHQAPAPAGVPIGVHQIDAKGIASSAPTRPTCHTNCSQSNAAGPAESDQQPGTVTSPPAYTHTPSRWWGDHACHHYSCGTDDSGGARNAIS